MRANQRRLAQSLANAPRTDTRDVKRGLAVVPFRHSKLTEVLMDYFVGDGKAVSSFPHQHITEFVGWLIGYSSSFSFRCECRL